MRAIHPGAGRRSRWATTALGLVVVSMGIGKLLAPAGYLAALSKFDVLPPNLVWWVGWAWLVLELASGAALLVAGLASEPPRLSALAAGGALLTSLGYAALTFSARARGLSIENCTCFGVYLPQRLSLFVLFQDVYMVAFSSWQLLTLRRWSGR